MTVKATPLHPAAEKLSKAGFFSKLTCFDELELRVANIQDNKEKGDAFEVFAEAYLATQRKHDEAKVWPQESAPEEILRKLSLPVLDYGVDGVIQTSTGVFNAYQVKFRADRKPLSWRELSTFIGLADSNEITSRILLTNCDDVPTALEDRRGFFCIRGTDLDRLGKVDFEEIEAWISKAVFEKPKKKPLSHQREALQAIIPSLQKNDRTSVVMACGTGKTLLTLWVAEQMTAKTILVLLPSLALLRQTLHEWLSETSIDSLAYLCVCSDRTVTNGIDSTKIKQSDLDFEVLTKPENVRGFLDREFSGVKFVFSTYQSAHVIGEAMNPGETFDFGVFDEAHKTAGREGRSFSFALDDENLPISKRLFVTATPRKYNPIKRNKDGDSSLVCSMDNPEVYGPVSYRLGFAEAVRREIICGYRVVITAISSRDVSAEALTCGLTNVEGDQVATQQVANQIALRRAVKKYDVKKIFTFHSTVAAAKSFTSSDVDGVGSQLPHFSRYHVSGAMPTSQRERAIKDFRSSDCALVSNARCLTEGVDVPSVDMVAFLSPRRSRVDIVQAAGRAMRSSPGKELGYILLPLYVEETEGETIEESVDRSNYSEIWGVLNALQEQDEILADLISEAGERFGKKLEVKDEFFSERILFDDVGVGLNELEKAISVRCLENLFSNWDFNFGKLEAFKEKEGHCDVPDDYEDASLARWVQQQRDNKKKKR